MPTIHDAASAAYGAAMDRNIAEAAEAAATKAKADALADVARDYATKDALTKGLDNRPMHARVEKLIADAVAAGATALTDALKPYANRAQVNNLIGEAVGPLAATSALNKVRDDSVARDAAQDARINDRATKGDLAAAIKPLSDAIAALRTKDTETGTILAGLASEFAQMAKEASALGAEVKALAEKVAKLPPATPSVTPAEEG